MYKAIIKTVQKKEDAILYTVEYTNGEESFERNYSFSLAQDIDNVLPQTIEYEKQRLSDLDTKFKIEVERIGEVI